MQKALIAGQTLLYQGGDQPRFSNGATMLTEMHFVASPPALEESPGDGGASKRPSGLLVLSAGGKYRAAGNAENGHGFCPVVWHFYGITV